MHRVLFLIPQLNHDLAADQAAMLARGLQARGHQVLLLAGGGELDPSLNGLETIHLAHRARRHPIRLHRKIRAFRPTVLHTLQPAGNQLGRLLALLFPRVRTVSMAHVPGDDATPFKRWWRTRWHSQTSRFVASTASLAGRWRACGFPSGRLAIIEPGIPVHARGARAPGGTLQIAFLGPMLRRKGGREAIWTLDILLHADVPAHLHLVGEGPELDRLHLFAHALRVRQHVSFHPWTAREAVLSSIADVVWAPGDKEDEPHAALYAMSFGLPVVATAIPGLVDVIANGQTGFLVPPGDKPALARRTLQLVEDVSLRQRLGSAAQEHVRVHFTPDRMIDRYLELYDKSQPHERICPPLMADRGDGAVPGIDHGVIGQGE